MRAARDEQRSRLIVRRKWGALPSLVAVSFAFDVATFLPPRIPVQRTISCLSSLSLISLGARERARDLAQDNRDF